MNATKRFLIQTSIFFLTFLVARASHSCLNAQTPGLSKSYKDAVIQTSTKELQDRYVFPEVAKQIAERLASLNSRGHFDKIHDLPEFLDSVNACIYQISKDKHISITVKEKAPSSGEANTDWTALKLEERMFFRRYNANFKSVEKLENNIGYLDLRGFYGLDYGREFADHAMAQLANSDAIIIDLRNNSGGRGDMVGYLLSYFFEDQIITGRSRKRTGDNYVDRTHTSPVRLKGKTLAQTPVFILTSRTTFSAAESFCFPMKVYERATIVGDTTKGGANAGDLISVNDELQIFIPDVASLPHPVANTTWEGIGIVPDIQVESAKALETALEHAKVAAATYKAILDEKAKASLLELNEIVSNYDGSNEQLIVDAYLACKNNDIIFEEWELNALGYQFLANENVETAMAIFKSNTVLYPHSANAFDSYAESLAKKGNMKEAIENYEKAVHIARSYKDDRLDMFMNNLKNARN